MTDWPWNRVVVWGGGHDLHSHRHIWQGFHDVARKLGIPSVWAKTGTPCEILPGDLVFAIDIWLEGMPVVEGAKYVMHNVSGDSWYYEAIRPENYIRLQVYTNRAHGEPWNEDGTRFWVKENRTLIQPWGSPWLAEEFESSVFNSMAKDCAFVGAIWDDGGLGNEASIPALQRALKQRGLRFVHLTQVSEGEMREAVRGSRIAPALVGEWQREHDYIPCRILKNSALGQLIVTNVSKLGEFMPGVRPDLPLEGLLDYALGLKATKWHEMVREQQRVTARYTYREAYENIARAFEEGRDDV